MTTPTPTLPLRDFRQVDVFTAVPYRGNPLAVVMDGRGLDDATLQRFAQWTNLSETTFLLPPTTDAADYRVRIFTPGGELPFAGHPTIGSCHAWLEAGGRPREPGRIVQECAVGPVQLVQDGATLAFEAPPLRRAEPEPALLAQVLEALGVAPDRLRAAQVLDNGPQWFSLLLDAPAAVLALAPDHARLKALGTKVGVAARYATPGPDGADLEVRAFAAPIGVAEDPVTGSLNASLAQWLVAEGLMPPRYAAAQGRQLGRDGRVQLTRDAGGRTWVGGQAVTCIAGQVRL